MAHGAPDDSDVVRQLPVYRVDDMAELAVRLGSSHLFDRRGNVIWQTDFQSGRGDIGDIGVPLNGAVQLWSGDSRQGGLCVRLVPFNSVEVALQKFLPYPVLSRLGLEFSFSVALRSEFITGRIFVDNGVNEWRGFIRYDEPNNRLEYMQEPVGPTWIEIQGGIVLPFYEGAPHTLKFVVDMSTTPPEFIRVILNDFSASLAGIPLYMAGSLGTPYMHVEIAHEADAVGTASISVDNIIVTQNEP